MSQSDDHFDEFEPRTLFKHHVLKSDFDAWPRILLLRPNAGSDFVEGDAVDRIQEIDPNAEAFQTASPSPAP